jgi:hypothetical protein
MEALILYSLVSAAVGLMLVGTYGAMPLLAEAPSAHARSRPVKASIDAGSTLAISETRLLTQADLPSTMARSAPIETARPGGGPNEGVSETEAILLGLHDEVDLLRDEIEGLRGELSTLIEIANRAQQTGRPKRRSDVPEPLRRQVNARRQVKVQSRA